MKESVTFTLNCEELGPKEITCYEVSPEKLLKELRKKMAESKGGNLPLNEFFHLLTHCCSLTLEEIEKLYPSEKKFIFEKFKEANVDFFLIYPKIQDAIKKLGVWNYLIEIAKELNLMEVAKALILNTWKETFAGSSNQGTSILKNTDGDSLNGV